MGEWTVCSETSRSIWASIESHCKEDANCRGDIKFYVPLSGLILQSLCNIILVNTSVAEHKKHHYVPRFYLKLFSENGRSINLFNIRTQRSVLDGALKNQCYRDYFYGKDPQIEKSLSLVEGQISQILNKVHSKNILPDRGSPDHITLLMYILIQHARTAYSAEMYDEQADKIIKHLVAPKLEGMNYSSERIASVRVTLENPARFALSVAAPHYPLLVDLKLKLIRATGAHEFITSDNPVVFYNQFLSFRKLASNTGLVSKGLLIFFPISPKQLIILYDGAVYGVGSKSCNVINISDLSEVEQINRLQFVSASENIYYFDKSFPALREFKASERYRRTQKSRMQVFQDDKTGEQQNDLVMISGEDIETGLTLKFLRIIKSAKRWRKEFQATISQPAAIVRNETLLKHYKDFLKLVEAGRYNHGEFTKYVREMLLKNS